MNNNNNHQEKTRDAANNKSADVYKRTGSTEHNDYKITAVPVKEKDDDEKKSIEPSGNDQFTPRNAQE